MKKVIALGVMLALGGCATTYKAPIHLIKVQVSK